MNEEDTFKLFNIVAKDVKKAKKDTDKEPDKSQLVRRVPHIYRKHLPSIHEDPDFTKDAPEFSFSAFMKEREQDPSCFLDVFQDGTILIKVLKEGSSYPDPLASVKVHLVCKRESDGKIFENTLNEDAVEFRVFAGITIPCLEWAASSMKIGEEILVYSHYKHAFGEDGQLDAVGPNENVLIYMKLISFTLSKFAAKQKKETKTLEEKIACADQAKNLGNDFYKRKLYKLAADQYSLGVKKLNCKKWDEVPANLQHDIKMKRSNLYRNIAAYYVALSIWEKGIEFCTLALEENNNCILSYARRGRCYAEISQFEKSLSDINKAKELDINNLETSSINTALATYKKKLAHYKQDKQNYETNIFKNK
uniref:peptidylprolyl isomerase n=1 Tax=Arcella intermedia TaxID=1963864 RepID=A0A6B2L7J4_9EUKA